MARPRSQKGEKNLIHQRLLQLRTKHGLSQRDLSRKLQLAGYDIDKNVIHRIETNQRYVSDIEVKAFCEIFRVSYSDLLDADNVCPCKTAQSEDS